MAAKRFTDSGKWKRPWFRQLSLQGKVLWQYLCDECDHAGIFIADFELVTFQVGFDVDEAKLAQLLGDKIVKVDTDKYFIPSYFDFQYKSAKEGFKAKQSALKILESFGLIEESTGLLIDLSNSYLSVTRQSTDCPSIGIGKGKIKGSSGGVGDSSEVTMADLEAAYEKYPLKKGKSKGLAALKSQVKTLATLEDLNRAIEIYSAEVAGRPADKIKHFSSFVNMPWTDCLDPNYGKSVVQMAPHSIQTDDWLTRAAQVRDVLKRHGTGTKAQEEIARELGPELHAIVIKAGSHNIRQIANDAYYLPTVGKMLRAAADLLRQKAGA